MVFTLPLAIATSKPPTNPTPKKRKPQITTTVTDTGRSNYNKGEVELRDNEQVDNSAVSQILSHNFIIQPLAGKI